MRYNRKTSDNMPVVIYPINDDRRDGILVMSGNDGNLLSYHETKRIVERLINQMETTDMSVFDETIENYNRERMIDALFHCVTGYEAYQNFPVSYLNVSKRKFKGSQKWSFFCGNCGEKITLETADTYYTMTPRNVTGVLEFSSHDQTERGCSLECMRVIAKDVALNGITNEYKVHFNLVDVMSDVVSYVDSL